MKTLRKIEDEINGSRQEIRYLILDLFTEGRITDEERIKFLQHLNEIQINVAEIYNLRTN